MEIVKMGRTELPLEVILEFLESLRQVYTVEVRCPVNTVYQSSLRVAEL